MFYIVFAIPALGVKIDAVPGAFKSSAIIHKTSRVFFMASVVKYVVHSTAFMPISLRVVGL